MIFEKTLSEFRPVPECHLLNVVQVLLDHHAAWWMGSGAGSESWNCGTSSKQLATKEKEHTNLHPSKGSTRKGKKGASSFQNKCRLVEDVGPGCGEVDIIKKWHCKLFLLLLFCLGRLLYIKST